MVRNLIYHHVAEKHPAVLNLDVEGTLRRLFPADREDGSYEYLADGNLLLHEPPRLLRVALADIATRCDRAVDDSGFVAEFAVRDVSSSFGLFQARTISKSVVIHVTAPRALREKRNAERSTGKVLAPRLDYYPERLPADVTEFLTDNDARIHEVRNEGESLSFVAAVRLLIRSSGALNPSDEVPDDAR